MNTRIRRPDSHRQKLWALLIDSIAIGGEKLMMTRLCAWLVLGAMLVLPGGGHAEDALSSHARFQFAWSVEERALAREALSRLPTDLPRTGSVMAIMDDSRF